MEKSSEELELDGENCEKNADLVKKESTEAMENGDLKGCLSHSHQLTRHVSN